MSGNSKAQSSTPHKSTLREQLVEICEKYGYFLGLGYEDENGNLKTHKKGKVVEAILGLIQTRDQAKRQELLEALPEKEDMVYWNKKYSQGDLSINQLNIYQAKNNALTEVQEAINKVLGGDDV